MSAPDTAALPPEPDGSAALPNRDDLDAVLLRNVRNGFVDYDGIKADPAFGRFVTGLASASSSDLDERNTRLAFLINAYNAFAIRGILDGYSPASLLGRYNFFKRREYGLLGETTSLDDLEHDQILPLGEPRVHFAIVCASIVLPAPRQSGLCTRGARCAARSCNPDVCQ